MSCLRWLVVVWVALVVVGCGDDEEGQGGEAPDCGEQECTPCQESAECELGTICDEEHGVCVVVRCEEHGDCPGATYCREEFGRCVPRVCVPGEERCDGDMAQRCDGVGAGFEDVAQCEAGDCFGGQCGCTSDAHCPGDLACDQGSCGCASGEACGDRCCGDGEACQVVEVCDGDQCQSFPRCQPFCEGEFCGFDGSICCDGETPVCGPLGECAPDCGDEGPLCGDEFASCCPAGDFCVFGECRTPGAYCEVFTDCDFDEYCDAGLGRCMPDEFPEGLVCEEEVDFDPFAVEELWHWEGIEHEGTLYRQVANTPVVADMTGDGVPEVAFAAYPETNINHAALVVISGATGETIYINTGQNIRGREHFSLADLTGNGMPEIVVPINHGIGAVASITDCPDPDADEDNCYLWATDVAGSAINQAISVADVTGDGMGEVLYIHSVFDGVTGEVIASTPQGQVSMPVALDLTGDGEVEILTAGCAWHVEEGEQVLQEVWCNDELPGYDSRHTNDRNYVGVGDVVGGDRAGRPEVIWVGGGEVFVVDEVEGEILHRLNLPGAVRGGPPVVADFDGDGSAEFGVGGQTCYTVFDLDCLGSDDEDLPGCIRPEFEECTPGVDCVVEPCAEVAGGSGEGILWSIEIVDSVTGTGFASAVFDFQGDGRDEVVYGDHCRVFVLDGRSGAPLLTRFASRRANSEMPIVVDVDGDGRSNLVYQANNDLFDRDCVDPIAERPDFFPECHEEEPPEYCEEGNFGLYALRDVNDSWVGTRAIWNQHAYHITNINDDATLPADPGAPWTQFNSFRANRQGEIPLNAPDVVVSALQINAALCPPHADLRATIQNLGKSGIPAGLPVSLYVTSGESSPALVETVEVEAPISPGGVAQVDFRYEVPATQYNQSLDFQVIANDDGADGEPVRDCNPDTAQALVEGVVCSIQY